MHKTVKVKVVKRASTQQNGNCIVFGPVEFMGRSYTIVQATDESGTGYILGERFEDGRLFLSDKYMLLQMALNALTERLEFAFEISSSRNLERLKAIKQFAQAKLDSKAIPEIIGATLLSIEEAKALPQHLKTYNGWWWLRAPGLSRYTAASICNDGSIYYTGDLVYNVGGCVRPALRIRNFESSDFKIGDRFKFGGREFEIISDNLAFCTGDIGRCLFRTDWRAPDANVYEASDVKKMLDHWFHECEQCEKARVNCK